MRILYYNWVDYRDPEGRGGGVSIYQRNLLNGLGARTGIDVRFLCSGISHDPFSCHARVEPIRHGSREDRFRRFELVNSGAVAPGHHAFGQEAQIDHPATTDVFFDFLEEHGPFDIVHFNNLEGLPATVLTLKERFPATRVIYSLHNYYPLCPQVNLWHQERETCSDYAEGAKCTNCLTESYDLREVRRANALAYVLKKNGILPDSRLFGRVFRTGMRASSAWLRLSGHWSPSSRDVLDLERQSQGQRDGDAALVPAAKQFRNRRERMVSLLNANCDRILCVSDRAALVARTLGIDPALLQTSYIGTHHADRFQSTAPRSFPRSDGTVTLAYLGYMRRDKGFFFLMKALKTLPEPLAKRVRILICARNGDAGAMEELRDTRTHLKAVRHVDGYAPEQLDTLLEDVDIGVVPVQWEDNLPQVAIEMHARRIPLLTSDLGGAQELGNSSAMVFRAGSIESFHQRMNDILEDRIDFGAYWSNAMTPISMRDHEDALLGLYRDLLDRPAAADRS